MTDPIPHPAALRPTSPAGSGVRANTFKIGDYVMATKYSDGDPADGFCVGFYNGVYEHPTQTRFMVIDSEGKNFRGNGFRECRHISRSRGEWIVKNIKKIETCNGVSVWHWYRAPIRELLLLDPDSEISDDEVEALSPSQPDSAGELREALDKIAAGRPAESGEWIPALSASDMSHIAREACRNYDAARAGDGRAPRKAVDIDPYMYGYDAIINQAEGRCDDCPPVGYPTDKTRCAPCPRRAAPRSQAHAGEEDWRVEELRNAFDAFYNHESISVSCDGPSATSAWNALVKAIGSLTAGKNLEEHCDRGWCLRTKRTSLACKDTLCPFEKTTRKELSDWSTLPKDIYVIGAQSVENGIGFDVQCCSVPMVTAPEVRYARADLLAASAPLPDESALRAKYFEEAIATLKTVQADWHSDEWNGTVAVCMGALRDAIETAAASKPQGGEK